MCIDSREFESYVEARWDALVRAACFLGCTLPEAEDLVQTTLTKCFVHWKRVSRAGNADNYVYTALVNQQRSNKRRRWCSEQPTDKFTQPAPGSVAEDSARALMVQGALNRLSDSHRSVVVARHILDLSEAETAEVLGVPVGTVKSRLSRGLAALAADPDLQTIEHGGV